MCHFSTALHIDPNEQKDPCELLQMILGEHIVHWQVMFLMAFEEHVGCCMFPMVYHEGIYILLPLYAYMSFNDCSNV